MFHKKKFSDLHKDVICGDMVMAESNTMPKFLIVADGIRIRIRIRIRVGGLF